MERAFDATTNWQTSTFTWPVSRDTCLPSTIWRRCTPRVRGWWGVARRRWSCWKTWRSAASGAINWWPRTTPTEMAKSTRHSSLTRWWPRWATRWRRATPRSSSTEPRRRFSRRRRASWGHCRCGREQPVRDTLLLRYFLFVVKKKNKY